MELAKCQTAHMDDTAEGSFHFCATMRGSRSLRCGRSGISRATVRQDRPAHQRWAHQEFHRQAPARCGARRDERDYDDRDRGRALEQILKALRGFPEISAIRTTNRHWDVVVKFQDDGLDTFDKALRRIRKEGHRRLERVCSSTQRK